jgi:DNA-binding MarR family transcriptional regulator
MREKDRQDSTIEQIESDLRAIRRAMRQPLEMEIAGSGLTPPQLNVIRAVVREGGLSLKDLSQKVGLAHSTVSGIVDRLEAKGLLVRRSDLTDTRVVRIHASKVVTKFVNEQLQELSGGPLQRALKAASRKDQEKIMAAVRRLRELFDSIQAGNPT